MGWRPHCCMTCSRHLRCHRSSLSISMRRTRRDGISPTKSQRLTTVATPVRCFLSEKPQARPLHWKLNAGASTCALRRSGLLCVQPMLTSHAHLLTATVTVTANNVANATRRMLTATRRGARPRAHERMSMCVRHISRRSCYEISSLCKICRKSALQVCLAKLFSGAQYLSSLCGCIRVSQVRDQVDELSELSERNELGE